MRLNLSADEVLTTTRSVRKRLDFDRPVEREIVLEALDIALQAPTGSNRQGWQWVFVEDADTKLALRDIYRENFRMYREMPRPKYEAGDPRAGRQDAVMDSADYLADNFHRAPLLLFALLFYLVGHSIESSVWPLEMVYEHRNYLPSIGPCMLIAAILSLPLARGKTTALPATLSVTSGPPLEAGQRTVPQRRLYTPGGRASTRSGSTPPASAHCGATIIAPPADSCERGR